MADRRILPGSAAQLGALFDGQGTNFAVYAAGPAQVWLCLFDTDGIEERIELTEVDAYVWHCYLPGVGAGQRYAYRLAGDWAPDQGKRWNPAKLLLDPYALAVDGPLNWGTTDADAERVFDYRLSDGSPSDLDSAPAVPRCVVIDRSFNWGNNEVRPRRELADTIIYETHVRAFTRQHPSLEADEQGTYKGLTHPDVLKYLTDLGVTAIELMPVQQFFSNRGESNFWGYNSICWMAPHGAYASAGHSGEQVSEFKEMVKALHVAGFEVFMDVVFNHTVEGGNPAQDVPPPPPPLWQVGPSLSFRGIDNRSYYLLGPDQLTYIDKTGVGNTVNIWDPALLRLIMDALRYWATDMHIDGFRFDEAAVLAETDNAHSISAFLYELGQDPVLSQLKLIAEPWFGDSEPQLLGKFPPLWSQWNGDFHWALRDFWKSTGNLRQMANGLLGSPQTFQASVGELPTASVNYSASHDGKTTRDAVSYNDTQHDVQHAWDCRTGDQADNDPSVLKLRMQLQRAHLATAILAQGMPMIVYGDECGRTQDGNSNPYNIDSLVTWMPWEGNQDLHLLAFAQRLIALRKDHPVFRRRRFFQAGAGVSYYRPAGSLMPDVELDANGPCAASIFFDGKAIPDPDQQGNSVNDTRSFLLLLNANWQDVQFIIPLALGDSWQVEIAAESPAGDAPGNALPLLRPGRSLLVLSTPIVDLCFTRQSLSGEGLNKNKYGSQDFIRLQHGSRPETLERIGTSSKRPAVYGSRKLGSLPPKLPTCLNLHRRMRGHCPLMPHIARQLQQDVDVSRRVLTRRSTSADGSRGLQQTSHTGQQDGGLPRRFIRRQGDTERREMSVELPATLISRPGGLAGELDDDHVLARLASAAWPGRC